MTITRTRATFAPPITEARRWLDGKSFPPERPLINVSQAAPVAAPPIELRQHMADLALNNDEVHLYGPDLGFPALREELARFKNADFVWCQEEPKNQGAWLYFSPHIERILTEIGAKNTRPGYAGRAPAAAPATGQASKHKEQQTALVNEALTLEGK